MSVDSVAIVGLAGIDAAVAGFYYTVLRTDVKELVQKPIPFDRDAAANLHRRLSSKAWSMVPVLSFHILLTVLFVTGAVMALSHVISNASIEEAEAGVVVIAGLAAMHLWVIAVDLLSLHRRLGEVQQAVASKVVHRAR